MCLPLTKPRTAGSEIFTTSQITMRLKINIWNSDFDKLKKYNVCGGEEWDKTHSH